jgi:hypothetical protein
MLITTNKNRGGVDLHHKSNQEFLYRIRIKVYTLCIQLVSAMLAFKEEEMVKINQGSLLRIRQRYLPLLKEPKQMLWGAIAHHFQYTCYSHRENRGFRILSYTRLMFLNLFFACGCGCFGRGGLGLTGIS